MGNYRIIIMSMNPECNKNRGSYTTIEKAREAALKWKGKYDYYDFPYERVEIVEEGSYKTVEVVNLYDR